MTLHRHKVDDRTLVSDGDERVPVPAGWQIADGNSNDARVCGAHPWQSNYLVFADGGAYCTAKASRSSDKGALAQGSDVKFEFSPHACK